MSTTTSPRPPSPAAAPPGGAVHIAHIPTVNDVYVLTQRDGQH
jgi:hypothetical protein